MSGCCLVFCGVWGAVIFQEKLEKCLHCKLNHMVSTLCMNLGVAWSGVLTCFHESEATLWASSMAQIQLDRGAGGSLLKFHVTRRLISSVGEASGIAWSLTSNLRTFESLLTGDRRRRHALIDVVALIYLWLENWNLGTTYMYLDQLCLDLSWCGTMHPQLFVCT